MVTDILVRSSAEMGMFIKIDGHLPNGSYWEYSFALWQGIINCPPNSSYRLTVYTWSVISSTHQALSRWHLHNGSLHGVEGTQLTFVGFENTFSPPGDLLALSPPGPRFNRPTEEVTTSMYLSLCSISGVGRYTI